MSRKDFAQREQKKPKKLAKESITPVVTTPSQVKLVPKRRRERESQQQKD